MADGAESMPARGPRGLGLQTVDDRFSAMRHALFLLMVLCACLAQVSVLASYPLMPELPLALVAWAMIDGTEEGVLGRSWVTGLVYDLLDPGAFWFHAVAFTGIALALLPMRNLLFRRRWAAWAGWAAVCTLVMAAIDGAAGGWGDTDAWVLAAQILLNATAAAGLGWLMAVIPHPWHPLGRGGA